MGSVKLCYHEAVKWMKAELEGGEQLDELRAQERAKELSKRRVLDIISLLKQSSDDERNQVLGWLSNRQSPEYVEPQPKGRMYDRDGNELHFPPQKLVVLREHLIREWTDSLAKSIVETARLQFQLDELSAKLTQPPEPHDPQLVKSLVELREKKLPNGKPTSFPKVAAALRKINSEWAMTKDAVKVAYNRAKKRQAKVSRDEADQRKSLNSRLAEARKALLGLIANMYFEDVGDELALGEGVRVRVNRRDPGLQGKMVEGLIEWSINDHRDEIPPTPHFVYNFNVGEVSDALLKLVIG